MMENNDIALFDMDGSLADYEGALVRELQALRSPDEPSITDENLWHLEKSPHMGARMKLIKNQPGWWEALKPIEMGLQALEWSKRFGFDVHVLTKGPKKHPAAWEEKVRWCQKHIGQDVDIHVTADKGLVYGKLLYDDYPDYMLRWLQYRPRGLGIMPVTCSNKDFTHPQVLKLDGTNWSQFFHLLKMVKDRKPGHPLKMEY